MRDPIRRLTTDEHAQILAMDASNMSGSLIARHLGVNYTAVQSFLRHHRHNGKVARAYIDSKLDKLAKRVVKDADVDQCLEIFDRTDTLVKKRDPAAGVGNQFVVCIGMPGQPLPVPDEKLALPAEGHHEAQQGNGNEAA